MLKSYGWGGGPCDFSASPSPFGLDFGTLDFGLGLDNYFLPSFVLMSPGNIRYHTAPEDHIHLYIFEPLLFCKSRQLDRNPPDQSTGCTWETPLQYIVMDH